MKTFRAKTRTHTSTRMRVLWLIFLLKRARRRKSSFMAVFSKEEASCALFKSFRLRSHNVNLDFYWYGLLSDSRACGQKWEARELTGSLSTL